MKDVGLVGGSRLRRMRFRIKDPIDNGCGREDNIGEGVAPTVERWTPNPTVVGSNPTALTFFPSLSNKLLI
jgi:hypothetical protein